MRIAYTTTEGKGDLDLVLARFAQAAQAAGLRTCGVVQINSECAGGACDMDVQVLGGGPAIRISQNLGPDARGCRLDPAALEEAVGQVAARLDPGVDVFILNKFGKHEADGRGFRDLIGQAIALDVPVVSGVNGLNRDAFVDFTGGIAEFVPPEPDALMAWLRREARQPA
ncbi:Protein of unknown function [Salinihabitans flavidus]|uniref:Nucleoside-triphosphatase THEP1 n=1 Tax=Salinihabitans flavidus TaxID=569882 RepID=A0A1H8QZ03_9RHOB|nr:DUF2478 domain-containing protein [Salinihabitans flavidus]SEO59415.1 Protein of unknown function [Salinihabitans flavidus]